MGKYYRLLGQSVTVLFFSLATVTSVQAACGSIITNYDYYGDGLGPIEEFQPIEDCTNPFNADTPAPFTYELTLAEQPVTAGSLVSVVETVPVTGSFSVSKTSTYGAYPLQFFLQEGEDYRLVESINTPDFTIASLEAGAYVAVFTYEYPPILNSADSLWYRWLKNIFVAPTAYAFYPDSAEVVAVHFTVAYETPVPTGASSVLFLPGIQASRLYTDGALGTENQLWEPNRSNDVEMLAMTSSGVSINDIYTRDVIDEVNFFPVGQGNIYKGFLGLLEDLKSDEVIKDYQPFAYDWRYSVFNVATEDVLYEDETKRLLEEVLALADESYTGKVTLIGHSNGGLVAKALLHEYGETELAGKIDKFVMIGTPQLGTPKAVGSMLHGLDQSLGFGLVATANTIRQVTKNIPGAYSLLPSPRYFEIADEPLIKTDGSQLAEPVAAYGDIDTAEALQDFILDKLDTRGEAIGFNEPMTLNSQLATEALLEQRILDDWQAPSDVEVFEVVGTGLATVSSYEYREYGCRDVNPACILNSYLKPFPVMTNKGDQTVVTISSEGYEGDKVTAVVNLYDASFLKPETHANLTESREVQTFIDSVIKYPYFTEVVTVPDFTEVTTKYTIIAAHSPVSLLAQDSDGNKVGIVGNEIKTDIFGSQYFEFGDSKYVVLPTEANVSVEVAGTGDGVYSLSIDEINESGQQSQVSLLANSTTSLAMKAMFSIENGEYSLLKTDVDGDGVIDIEQTLDGEVAGEPDSEYSYVDLRLAIESLHSRRSYEKSLLAQAKLAESFSLKSSKKPAFKRLEYLALTLLEKSLMRYYKRGLITEEEVSQIKEIINNLK